MTSYKASSSRDEAVRNSAWAAELSPDEIERARKGISERLIPVPVVQGNYEQLRAAEGAFLWLAAMPEGVTGDGRASTADQAPALWA